MATRHNLCINPGCKNNVTGWGGGSTPTQTTGLTGMSRTTGARYTSGTFAVSPSSPASPGDVITMSVDVLSETGADASVDLIFEINGTTGVGAAVNFSLSAGVPTRVSITRTCPGGTTSVDCVVDSFNAGVSPLVLTGLLIEIAPAADTYFDGDTPGASWDGADGNSASTLVDVTAAGGTQPTLPPHLLRLLAARNQAMWQAGSASTPVTSDTGTSAAASALTGTAVKVASTSGRCAATAAAQGAAAKKTAQTGTSATAAASTGTAKKVAPQSSTSATAARVSGIAVKVAKPTGTTAAASFLSGAVGSRPESGAAAAATAATAIAVKVTSVAGRCATVAVARATAVKRAVPQGPAAGATMLRASAVKRATPSSATLVAASCGAAAIKSARPTGFAYAATYTAKIDLTRNLSGIVGLAAALIVRHNPSSRPGSGSTARPDGGGILRPYSGVIHRP
jgi:hypothetical protein